MTVVKCQHCKAEIANDPQHELEEGRLDTYVSHVVHPDDSIAVAQTWYYCNPQCFVAQFGGNNGGA